MQRRAVLRLSAAFILLVFGGRGIMREAGEVLGFEGGCK